MNKQCEKSCKCRTTGKSIVYFFICFFLGRKGKLFHEDVVLSMTHFDPGHLNLKPKSSPDNWSTRSDIWALVLLTKVTKWHKILITISIGYATGWGERCATEPYKPLTRAFWICSCRISLDSMGTFVWPLICMRSLKGKFSSTFGSLKIERSLRKAFLVSVNTPF